jgi:hypothetical protein
MGVQIAVAQGYVKGLSSGVYTSLALPQGKRHLSNKMFDAIQAGMNFRKEDV